MAYRPQMECAAMNRLKEVLDQQGLTQAYLAWRVGVPECSVSKWCAGTRTPMLKTALKIAKILGTTVEYLWGDSEESGAAKIAIDGASFYTMQVVDLTEDQAKAVHDMIFREGKMEI